MASDFMSSSVSLTKSHSTQQAAIEATDMDHIPSSVINPWTIKQAATYTAHNYIISSSTLKPWTVEQVATDSVSNPSSTSKSQTVEQTLILTIILSTALPLITLLLVIIVSLLIAITVGRMKINSQQQDNNKEASVHKGLSYDYSDELQLSRDYSHQNTETHRHQSKSSDVICARNNAYISYTQRPMSIEAVQNTASI